MSRAAVCLSLAGLLLAAPVLRAASPAACDQRCLRDQMDRYLDHLIAHRVDGIALAANAVLRENIAPVKLGEGVWKSAQAVRARQDFPDAVSGQVWSFIGLELQGGQIVQMSVRLRIAPDRRIAEIETVLNTGSDASGNSPYPGGPFLKENVLEPDVLFTAPVPRERRSTRDELIRLANGYFEGIGTLDPGAAKFGIRCQRFESGAGGGINLGGGRGRGAAAVPAITASNIAPNGYSGGASHCGGAMGGNRQTTIERRFPVAIPELGIVIGYMFIMHHERTPPQDNFINEIFKVVDGKIRQIDAVGFQFTAPARSGFVSDFPDPGVIRSIPRAAATVAAAASAPAAGIAAVRDVAYGPDANQRIDILYPAAQAAKPRTVLIFVHGGGWTRGDKHAPGNDLYENVMLWAARQGMVAVNVNYRLADYDSGRNLYPVEEQDVAAAVDWAGAHIAHYGGDAQRMFLWGHSAGGSLVASYATDPKLHGQSPLVKGIFLFSAPLDMTLDEASGRPVAYYGNSHQEFVDRSPIKTLAGSHLPVLLGYSADETGLVPMHMDKARQALCDAGRCPAIIVTRGTHQGEMQAVGSDDRSTTDALLKFIEGVK